MISRQQIIQRLSNLKSVQFVAYINRIDSDCHLVRLRLLRSDLVQGLPSYVLYDWQVFECSNRVLKAISNDQSVCIELT
jgi:hypothetical protein